MPRFDLKTALRLAREGRLKEALAVLRGAPVIAAAPSVPQAHRAEPGKVRFERRKFSNESGSRFYWLCIPSGTTGMFLPLIVMLHGCTQSAGDFATGTRMNKHADIHKFLVAYPEQTRLANFNKCWNWFRPEDQSRDQGEPSFITGITREIMAEFQVPVAKIFIAGISAGGAMAATLGALYPEIYAAIGVHSGLAYGAAHDTKSAMLAMRNGAASVRANDHPVRAIIFHGDADKIVNAANAAQIIAQASKTGLECNTIQGESLDGVRYTKTIFTDAAGQTRMESWILHGAGHAWSGGDSAGTFAEPRGPDASVEMQRFFLL